MPFFKGANNAIFIGYHGNRSIDQNSCYKKIVQNFVSNWNYFNEL